MDITPTNDKFMKELLEFKSICCDKLIKSKYDHEKNADVHQLLKEYLTGNMDALHMLRTAKLLKCLPPQQFVQELIHITTCNRSV